MHDDGFHEGELLAQRRADVRDDAQRLAGILTRAAISAGMSRFVAEREQLFLTSVDDDGRLWTSALSGPAGFCDGHDRTLIIAARPAEGDPLRDVGNGRPAGALFVDFARRRRLRVNGFVHRARSDGLEISVDQAFGNCPRYIRPLWSDRRSAGPVNRAVHRATRLDTGDNAQITSANTFVLGTRHPGRGADTSHRGGDPGFVRLRGGNLWWPDYPGNNLFNSIGNLLVDPAASLLFLDPEHERVLQLSGHAEVDWSTPSQPDADGETGRIVRFAPEVLIRSSAVAGRTS